MTTTAFTRLGMQQMQMIGMGAPATATPPPVIASLINGFQTPDSLLTGPLFARDYLDALVSAGADRLAILRMRLATTVAEGSTLGTSLSATTFTNNTGSTRVTNVAGVITMTGAFGSDRGYSRYMATTAGRKYQACITLDGVTGGVVIAFVGDGNLATPIVLANGANVITQSRVGDDFLYVGVSSGTVSGTVTVDYLREVIPQWLTTDLAGTSLYPSRAIRTRTGTAIQYTGGFKGMLVMPARTNSLVYSEQFDNAAWVKTGCTVGADVVPSPFTGFMADALTEDTSSGSHRVVQSATLPTGMLTISIFCKKGAGRDWTLLWKEGDSKGAYFNLATGAIGTVSAGVTASIESFPNGWYRCVITLTASSTAGVTLFLASADTVFSYPGNSLVGAYAFGAQAEVGVFATPYIPTVATTMVRAATVASYNSAGRLSAQNCVVWLRRNIESAGQTAWALNSYTDASNELGIQFTPTTILFRKRVGTVDVDLPLTFTHIVGYNDVQFAPTDQGMLIRASADEGATWTAWAENASVTAAVIATTFQDGRNGTASTPLACAVTMTATAFLPTQATLGGYKTWIETNAAWNLLGA